MVTATGLGSGLDINALVTGIVDAERVPLMERLDSRKSDVDGLVTGFDSLSGSLSSIRDAIANLVDSNKLNATATESTQSSVVSATASATAQTGTYEVNVSQLAETQSLISGNFTATSDVVGSGTLAIAIGTPTYNSSPNDGTYASFTQTSTVNVTIPANATLAGVRDAINSSSAGVNASILFDGSNYRLMLSGNSTGAAQAIAITVSGDSAGSDTDASGLSQLAFDANTANLTQVREAKNAALTINGVSLTSTSNTVTNVVDGLSLTLQGTTSSSATVSIAHDSAAVIDSINSFVTAYNTHNGSQKSLTKYDVTTGAAGVLQGDAMTRTILTQLRNMITTEIAGLTGSIANLTDLGITVQSDGSLKVDEATLETAVTTNFASVEKFFLGETVSGVVVTGFGTQLDALLDGFLDPDGLITEKLTSLDSKLEDIEADRTLYTRRMEALEERYYRQFNAMDTLLGQLTTTGEMLKNQLDALPGYQNLRQSGNR